MTILDRIKQKAQQAFQGVGNFIDRDKQMGGVQLVPGGWAGAKERVKTQYQKEKQYTAASFKEGVNLPIEADWGAIFPKAFDKLSKVNVPLSAGLPFLKALPADKQPKIPIGRILTGSLSTPQEIRDIKTKLQQQQPLTEPEKKLAKNYFQNYAAGITLDVAGLKSMGKATSNADEVAEGLFSKNIDVAKKYKSADEFVKVIDDERIYRGIPDTAKRLDDIDPKVVSNLFDKSTVEQNERLLRLMTEKAEQTGDTKTYKRVIENLETVLNKTRQEVDQPGYMRSLVDTVLDKKKLDIDQPGYIESLANVPKVVEEVAPAPQTISPDNVSETLKTYRKTGSAHINTPDVWNKSVVETTNALEIKHTQLKNLLAQVDADNGKQHLADIIQGNAKPKSQLYDDASKLYKTWSDDLADIEGLSDLNKVRTGYYAAYSNEQIYSRQLREMAGGTPESLFELPHLKTKTDLDNIGNASLTDTFQYRTKGASLNAHSGATMDVTPAASVIRKFQDHVTKQIKNVEAGGKYKVYDLIGDFQKQFKGQKKIVEARLFTIGNKATHTFDMVMQKIAKSGGEDLNKKYQMVRESDILVSNVLNKMGELDFNGKMNLLKKIGIDADEGLIKYLIDKKGMTEESVINMLLDQKLRKNAINSFIEKAAEYEFTDPNVKNAVNDFANSVSLGEISKDNLLNKLTRQVISTVATAHLGLNPVTAVKQLFEITRAPVYAGFKNTVVGVMKALNPFDDVTRKYGLKEFESNYVPQNTGFLKGSWDKVKDVLFIPMQKMELFKNRVFSISMEEALKNNDMKQIEKLHKIRDVLFGGGNVAHKYNKPLILKGSAGQSSTLGDALGLYFQFSMKNFDIKLNELQHGEYKKFGQLLASDLTSAALTSVVFGYPLAWALENLLPVGNPVLAEVFTKLYDNFKQHGQSVESGKDKDKTKSRYYLNRSLAQNVLPAGTQGVRDYEAKEIMDKGADYSPIGYKRWEAPTEPLEKAKMFLFGKTATKNYKEYRKELDESGWQPAETPKGIEGLKLAGKGALDYFTGFGSNKAGSTDKTPAITKQDVDVAKENITFGLDAGKIPEKTEIQSGLFGGKSATSETIAERMDVYKQLKTVMDNEYYSDEQKEAVLEASGAPKEDAEYYNLAAKDMDVKLQELLPELDKMSNEELMTYLMQGRREIGDKQLITSGMIDYLYEKDYIGKNEKEALKALQYDQVEDEFYFKKSYSGGGGTSGGSGGTSGGSGGKKLSYAQALKLFKIDLPKYSELKSVKNLLATHSGGVSQTSSEGDMLLSNILNRKAVSPKIQFS